MVIGSANLPYSVLLDYPAVTMGTFSMRVVQAGERLSDRAFQSRRNPYAAGTSVKLPNRPLTASIAFINHARRGGPT